MKDYFEQKITDAQVAEIKKIYRMAERVRKQTGATHYRKGMQRDLAARFGVSPRLIRYIRTGERRKSVKLSKRKA